MNEESITNKFRVLLQKTGRRNIVVALSGGADSAALLCFAKKNMETTERALYACHVNHGLRGGEADRDEQFVRALCLRLDVELDVVRLEMTQRGESGEERARELRYAALFECADRHDAAIATAHTQDDCAETLLLNLARGSGLAGASGIPEVRGIIIRPFLEATRSETERICRENEIEYVTDSSNLSDEYARNRIRHAALPALKTVNEAAVKNLAAFCERAREADDYISGEAEKLLGCCETKNGFDAKIFLSAHPALRSQALKKLIEPYSDSSLLVSLSEEKIRTGGAVQLDAGVRLVSQNGVFSVIKDEKRAPEEFSLPVISGKSTKIGRYYICGTVISYKDINENLKSNKLFLKNAVDYDRIIGNPCYVSRPRSASFSSAARGNTKSLKKLYNELHIPPEDRENYPLVADDRGIVWIKGAGASKRAAADEKTKTFLVFEIKKGE